jgi:hypothetical protein
VRGLVKRPVRSLSQRGVGASTSASFGESLLFGVQKLDAEHPEQFGSKQHSIVQRLLKRLRKKAAEKLIAHELLDCATNVAASLGSVDGSGYIGPDPPTAPPVERASKAARLNRSVDVGRTDGTTWVTFAGEAIRRSKVGSRLTFAAMDRRAPSRRGWACRGPAHQSARPD